jgi:alpha-amylase
VHQPFRLRNYSVFDIGNNQDYFDELKNKQILEKVSNKCYLPANNVILKLLDDHPEFRASYSFSGVVLEQFEKYSPKTLESFQKLVDTGNVEILAETSHHSLSSIYSKQEFKEQIKEHEKKIRNIFSIKPKIFRNTELIFNNEIANNIQDLGYKGILAEGADHILGWRSPNFLYTAKTASDIKLLLKNYKLSDDIAFRFSNKGWKEYPLTAEKYSNWISSINGNGNIVNLFMDYETFGEHQWEDTGIFRFMQHLPGNILSNKDNNFMTPSEVVEAYDPVAELDVHAPISWADMERDLSAWKGNPIQESALNNIYAIEKNIKLTNNPQLLEQWRKLTTSDHFYYMCTKYFSDGDVHKYFNPYDSPYDSFIAFMNILADLRLRIEKEQNMSIIDPIIKNEVSK